MARFVVYGPLALAEEMLRVSLPVLVSVTLCVPVLPTFTPLKFTDAGLIAICAWVDVPVPCRLMLRWDFDVLSSTEIFPVNVDADPGLNVTCNDTVCPALMVWAATLAIVKSAPAIVGAPIEMAAVPEFVSVTDCDAVLLSSTLPKSTSSVLAASVVFVAFSALEELAELVYPAQLDRPTIASVTANVARMMTRLPCGWTAPRTLVFAFETLQVWLSMRVFMARTV